MEQSKENHNRQEYNQEELEKNYYENKIQEALDEMIKEIPPPINFDNIKFDLE
jgi:hypothetical protein